ncbi:MAG TPA: TusE/DsrC/DsvC family sulfur relay protein [Bellilinea sp.]|nr:TusE/DsrC/DsvC family sulfur relay protein [Bellilinea sp.]
MSTDILNTIGLDPDGFMLDQKAWTKEIAEALAEKAGVTLTDRHWVVLDYARKQWEATGDAPSLRNITKNSGVDTKELYQLFPGGPGKLAAKIAWLKKPTGCI